MQLRPSRAPLSVTGRRNRPNCMSIGPRFTLALSSAGAARRVHGLDAAVVRDPGGALVALVAFAAKRS